MTESVHAGVLAAEALARHGVDTVFTLSGGHLFPFYDGCVQRGIRLVDVRHEQTAVFAAEAFAKVARRPGVAMLTAGPGVTNGISAITTAHLTGSPILVLGGRAGDAKWGIGSLQELDHLPIVASVTKWAATSHRPEDVAADVDRALAAARTPHRGPAFLDVPMDVAFASAPSIAAPAAVPDAASFRGGQPDDDDLDRIGGLVAEARRPVVIAGGDVWFDGAEDALVRMAERLDVPVVVNGMARGAIAADHPLAISRARARALAGADLVVVVGTPLDFRLGFGRFGDARVVHVADTPARIATHVPLAASAAGDLSACLGGITTAGLVRGGIDHDGWLEQLQGDEEELREAEQAVLRADDVPIKPARVFGELARRLDRDAVVIGDGGDFVSYAGRFVDTFEPGSFLDPGPYGCLGTGPGYALGAALGRPGRQLVLLLGDGAAGFSLGDWDTLARHRIPVVGIVGNNAGWGLEKTPMRKLYGYHVVADLAERTRYDEAAVALGCHGELVERPADIGPALDRAFAAGGPALVNVITDPADEYPRRSTLG